MLEKTLESPLDCKEIQPVHPKGNQIWILLEGLMLKLKLQYFGRLKRPWCWERLKVGREGDYKGWDGWTASLSQWTWVWASSGSWTPGVLQSMGSQRVRHDWATEPNWQVLSEDLVSALAAAAGILVNNWDRGKKCLCRIAEQWAGGSLGHHPSLWLPKFHLHLVDRNRTFCFVCSMLLCLLSCFSCAQLCSSMDCSPPGFSVHGILQARILEWVAMPSSRGVFPTWGLNLGLSYCGRILYYLSDQGSPKMKYSTRNGWTLVSGISCIGKQSLYH